MACLRCQLDDGRIELDNNCAERALRAVALGRKITFLPDRTPVAISAAMYILIGTAELNGLDPEAHLRTLLHRIADHSIHRIRELLPCNLSLTHSQPSCPRVPDHGHIAF